MLCMPVRKEKNMIAVHKTFEESEEGKRQVTLHTSDGKATKKIAGDKNIEVWLEGLEPGMILRFTAVHAQDHILNDLVERGHKIVYANWHKTGIVKGLSPEEIVSQFAELPASTFREFEKRSDLGELRRRVSQRDAVVEYRKAVILKLRGAATLYGQVDEEDISDEVKALLAEADKIDVRVPVTVNGKEKLVSIDCVIAKLASGIRECKLFNAVAHISDDSWNTAAALVAYSGGIDRFDQVSSLWHYCGQAPGFDRRKKGQPLSHNPRLKTKLWQLSDSIIKNRDNPWRDFYDVELERELAEHAVKHPGCKTPKGHSMARAKRKMRKEILKRFFLAVKGETYCQGGRPLNS
jgi:hypothetical protein